LVVVEGEVVLVDVDDVIRIVDAESEKYERE
jgi:hypothetical protein